MRFNKVQYKEGDERFIRKFAFLPIRVNKTTVVWLESYYVKQVLKSNSIHDSVGTEFYFEWENLELLLPEDYEYIMNLYDR